MNDSLVTLQQLVKALEAGNYNVAPSQLVQGAALQVEDLSPVMQNVTYDDSHIVLQKMVKVEPVKSTLAQWDRVLAYGIFGGAAQIEGAVGQEETSTYVRIVQPMSYYSEVRRVTLVANMVATVDGKKAEDRAAQDAAIKIAGDIEFDLFRGKANFSDSGVFNGNPMAIPALPNMLGLDPQIRQSDFQYNAQDQMFSEYGSDQSVVFPVGGVLTQSVIEDSAARSAMNMGDADKLLLDPITLANYNKIAFNKERIMLAGAPQGATGADLGKQWTSNGVIDLQSSRFLSGKTSPARPRPIGPAAPSIPSTVNSTTTSGVVSPFVAGELYTYYVTSVNELGESPKSGNEVATIVATGDTVAIVITPPGSGTVRYFNVYRTAANGSASTAKFIGSVARGTGSTVTFSDYGNRLPGSVTGFLCEFDTMAQMELSPYSRQKLAVVDLSQPEAFFRFLCLAVFQPRKNALLDSLV